MHGGLVEVELVVQPRIQRGFLKEAVLTSAYYKSLKKKKKKKVLRVFLAEGTA